MIVPNDEDDEGIDGDGNDEERLRRDMLAMINEKNVHEKKGYGESDSSKRRKKNGKQNRVGMQVGKAGGQAYAYIKMGKHFNNNFKEMKEEEEAERRGKVAAIKRSSTYLLQ